LKFLLDVHISTSVAKALSDGGHDVLRAALLDPTASDRSLLATAVTEGRVMVTQDSDYTELVFALGCEAPPAMIYIRCSPAQQPQMADRVLQTITSPQLEGHIAVITPTNTRFRALPKVANDHG
jgi:predicted nuclease of predicted toxin-antitoxin system